jgi:hypothetical protein
MTSVDAGRAAPPSISPGAVLLVSLVSTVGFASLPSCVVPISQQGQSGGTPPSSGSSSGGSTTAGSIDTSSIPSGSWTNVTANLANMASQCGNMSSVFAKPDEDLIVAGIALNGLWGTRDGGMTWTAMGTGAGSAAIVNRPASIVFDPSNTMRFWESGLYNGGGVYVTTDDGQTFAELGTVMHSDLVSVDFSDPNRVTLLAGGHEMPNTLNLSTDSGMNWKNVGSGVAMGDSCTFPLVLDSQHFLVGCSGYEGPSGVYRSTDGGNTWSVISMGGGASAPLRASDGSIYWIGPNGSGMIRSTDQGMTWTESAGGGALAPFAPVELPDGSVAAIGPTNGTQYVIVSTNHGMTWTPKTAALPYTATGFTYSPVRKAFYVYHDTCDSGANPVASDAIESFAYDTAKN